MHQTHHLHSMSSEAGVLLSHILARLYQDVDFLVTNNYISSADAAGIRSRLPDAPLPTSTQDHTHTTASIPETRFPAQRAAAIPVPLPAQRNMPQQAKALWAYNEQGTDPDLSFSQGGESLPLKHSPSIDILL